MTLESYGPMHDIDTWSSAATFTDSEGDEYFMDMNDVYQWHSEIGNFTKVHHVDIQMEVGNVVRGRPAVSASA
jgi:hypothetical protein